MLNKEGEQWSVYKCISSTTKLHRLTLNVCLPTNRNVLEEPGAHDTGSLLGENTTLVFRRVIISTKETQVLIELKLELQEVEGDTDQ